MLIATVSTLMIAHSVIRNAGSEHGFALKNMTHKAQAASDLREHYPSGKTLATLSTPPHKNIPLYRNSESAYVSSIPAHP